MRYDSEQERWVEEQEASWARTMALLGDRDASRALVRAIARRELEHSHYNEILAALCVVVAGMMEEP